MSNPTDLPRNFFGSDYHFGHRNIINFCGRPFVDLDEMREALIRDHNAVVRPQDRLYIVGDFSFLEPYETTGILQRMNGQKFLIKGNHDHQSRVRGVHGYAEVWTYKELKDGDDHIILSHYPFLTWNRSHHGSYHLHGHSHGTMRYPSELANARIFDVGIDHLYRINGSYSPVTWEWIRDQRLQNATFLSSLDQHTPLVK